MKGGLTMALMKFRNGNSAAVPQLWDNMFGSDFFDFLNTSPSGMTLPAVNIRENNESFTVEVAAPGLSKEDFRIRLEDNSLVISSEKETSRGETAEDDRYTRKEFSYQSFQRTFSLPQSVERENISASYRDGILYITVPKKEEAKVKPPREIQIK